MKLNSTQKFAGFVFSLLIVFNFLIFSRVFSGGDNLLKVYFLDVGQGDSTLIKTTTNRYILIDGGDGSNILEKLSEVMPFGERTIDLVIATHPDGDHIKGLIPVFDLYNVKSFLRTKNNEGNEDILRILTDKASNEGAKVFLARRGMVFDLGGGAYLETLFPDRDVSLLESNTSSVVNRLVYGKQSFLFTGDSPKSIEKYLAVIDKGGLNSAVLKIGHHGSNTSTSFELLEEVHPHFGVLSYGKDNRYRHPHPTVTAILEEFSIPSLATAGEGTIIFSSDGEGLSYKRK